MSRTISKIKINVPIPMYTDAPVGDPVEVPRPPESQTAESALTWRKTGNATGLGAEREGFEPSKRLITPYSLSRRAPSTTRPPLQD